MAIPRLPPELELAIFLLAYHNSNQDVKHLILVAKRVHDWVIPHAFRIVQLGFREFPISFNEAIYQKHGRHVRHLWLGSDRVGQFLYLFPNVIDLVYWEYEPAYLDILLQLPLKRLSIGSSVDLLPVIMNVTHLDIAYALSHIADTPPDLYLPNLTHLCVSQSSRLYPFLDRTRSPELWVAIIWEYGPNELDASWSEEQRPDSDDERIVVVQCHAKLDWLRGARGELDMWKFAEGIVESRKEKRIRNLLP